MRKSLILLLMLPCLTLQSQNLFDVNIDSTQKEIKKCIKLWEPDTVFLKKTDNEVHLQVWFTRIKDNYRWLSHEMKLTKSENPGINKSFFSYFFPSRQPDISAIYHVTGERVLSYKNYQDGHVLLYDTFGNPLISYEIRNGYLNGSFQVFYPNKELFSIGNFYEHAKSGLWVWFYPEKKVMMEGYYYPDVLMYCFDYGQDNIRLMNKFGKKYTLLDKMDYERFITDRPCTVNALPAYIEYRDKNWTIYNRDHKVVKKKKYNKTPVVIDNEFDTFIFEEIAEK